MNPVSIREMLECGVHFGHPVKRWNPKMKKFIFGDRNGISIIDLQKSARAAKKALEFVFESAANGGKVLFVGTKRQAMDVIQQESDRCGCYYVNQRWLGGLLTNFVTIQQSIRRLRTLEETLGDAEGTRDLKKKEIAKLEKERLKLDKVLHGIKEMKKLPQIVFIIDVMKERIAIQEARKLGIPIIAIVDTNCDPDGIDFVIPANDDAIRSIGYFASRVADATLEGEKIYKSKKAEEEAKKAEERAKLEKQRNDERVRREKEKKDRTAKAKKEGEGAESVSPEAESAPKGERKPARARKKEAAPAAADAEQPAAETAEPATVAETATPEEQ